MRMRKNFLHDSEGRMTEIKPDCSISWDPEGNCISIFAPPLTDDYGYYRWHGDDKKLVYFLSSPRDFRDFAEVLAMTHGLRIEVESPTWIRFAEVDG